MSSFATGSLSNGTCVRQLCVASETTDDVCAKQSAFGIIARQEFDRTEPVIFILPLVFWFF
jgi:hypothetical protein